MRAAERERRTAYDGLWPTVPGGLNEQPEALARSRPATGNHSAVRRNINPTHGKYSPKTLASAMRPVRLQDASDDLY
jgi:hypothetical protein